MISLLLIQGTVAAEPQGRPRVVIGHGCGPPACLPGHPNAKAWFAHVEVMPVRAGRSSNPSKPLLAAALPPCGGISTLPHPR